MCGKPRGHKPDRNQCCKPRTCDPACWGGPMSTVLSLQTPRWAVCRKCITVVYLSCPVFPVEFMWVSPLEESRWQLFFFFSVSLGYSESSFPVLLLLSLRSGLVFIPAWRVLAALSLPARPIHPFWPPVTPPSQPDGSRLLDWSLKCWLERRSFWKVKSILTSLFQTFRHGLLESLFFYGKLCSKSGK